MKVGVAKLASSLQIFKVPRGGTIMETPQKTQEIVYGSSAGGRHSVLIFGDLDIWVGLPQHSDIWRRSLSYKNAFLALFKRPCCVTPP